MIVPMYADSQKSLDKALLKAQQKEAKKKEKEYKKKGWEIMGSRTMEVALLKHYTKLLELGDNGLDYDGSSTRTKSKNLGEQMALNNALVKYAQRANSTVKGRIANEMNFDSATGEEFEKFMAMYERLVEAKLKNVLIPSYSVIKSYPDGTYDITSVFIVDESKARNARQGALEDAIKEANLSGKYLDAVREGVSAPVPNE